MTEQKREEKKKRERWRLEKLEEKEEEEKRGKKDPLSFPPPLSMLGLLLLRSP